MLSNAVGSSVFYIVAASAVIFAILTVTLKNIFHSALTLVGMLLAVAVFYIYLDAEFLALVQILIYVGAIMVLVIFAIMMTSEIYNKKIKAINEQKIGSIAISAVVLVFLTYIMTRLGSSSVAKPSETVTLAAIGRELLTTYALPFEFISIILLAALIGAVTISRKE